MYEYMNIALVEPHKMVADCLKLSIEKNENYKVIAQSNNYQQAKDFTHQADIELVIIELSLPDKNGIELIKLFKRKMVNIKIIVVTGFDTNPHISQALEAGADGYISKYSGILELFNALSMISKGHTYLEQNIINNLNSSPPCSSKNKLSLLTDREIEIFLLLAKGLNSKKIASLLDVMPKTIYTHRAKIYKKLDVFNEFELLKIALSNDILKIEEIH